MRTTQIWNIPCLGMELDTAQLESMDAGIWEYILNEMKDDVEFMNTFSHKAPIEPVPKNKHLNVVDFNAPIPEVVSNEGEIRYPTQIPENSVLVPLTYNSTKVDYTTSKFYKYDSIIPNDVPQGNGMFSDSEMQILAFVDLPNNCMDYENVNKILDAYENLHKSQLDDNRVYLIDGVYVSETNLTRFIPFLIGSRNLDRHVLLAYVKELYRFRSVASFSKYITEEVMFEIGWMMDWNNVSHSIYTEKIVQQFSGRINKKIGLYINPTSDLVFKSKIDDIIVEYLESKNALLEDVAQREFIMKKTNVGLANMANYEDEYTNMMFDDNSDDEAPRNDSFDLLQVRKAQLGVSTDL